MWTYSTAVNPSLYTYITLHYITLPYLTIPYHTIPYHTYIRSRLKAPASPYHRLITPKNGQRFVPSLRDSWNKTWVWSWGSIETCAAIKDSTFSTGTPCHFVASSNEWIMAYTNQVFLPPKISDTTAYHLVGSWADSIWYFSRLSPVWLWSKAKGFIGDTTRGLHPPPPMWEEGASLDHNAWMMDW